MSRKRKRPRFSRTTKPGAAPGSLADTPNSPHPVIQVMAFHQDNLVEETIEDLTQLKEHLDEFAVTWVNVTGLGDARTIGRIGRMFGLHDLALEDVLNVHQRAKVEPYDDHLFVVTRRIIAEGPDHLASEQISVFIGKNFVLTFQQIPGDCFNPVRERIRGSRGRIRVAGADYIAYALIDAVIDSYFPIVDKYADQLDDLEDEVTIHQNPEVVARLHDLRNDLLTLRRNVRPHRDALNLLVRDQHPLIADETRVFLRDTYDHTIQLIELLEVYREMCSDLRDYYASIVSNRMNEIMKVLTIIATLFIPLSFIAGLYGMNFNTKEPGNMPELNLPYGYVGALIGMTLMACGMLGFFWRKGWIGSTWRW
jgi:magnesium transporter